MQSKSKTLNWLRKYLARVFDLPYSAESDNDMDKAISLWLDIYSDEPVWLKQCHSKTLNLASAVSSEFARLITIEFKSEITGSDRADFLQTQYEMLLEQLRTKLEAACAVGGLVIKPYVKNGAILPDIITQDKFVPISYSNGIITSAIFISQEIKKRVCYNRVEKHIYSYKDRTHTIESRFFVSRHTSSLGREVSLENIKDDIWSEIDPNITISNVDRPLFAFWRVPLANQIDSDSPLGVSVFSRAIRLLKEADLQWDRLLWEYEGGQLAVYAGEEALSVRPTFDDDSDQPTELATEMPQSSERLLRKLGISADDDGKSFFEVFNPTLRDENLRNGLDEIKRQIEFACQLAYGTLSNPQNVDKTAEEIRSSKQRSYTAVRDMQTSLEATLEDYIYAMNAMTDVCELAPKGDYEVSFDWGDGVLEDKDKEQAIQLQEVNSGIRKKTDYIKWRYGVDDKKAEEMIPQTEVADFFEG